MSSSVPTTIPTAAAPSRLTEVDLFRALCCLGVLLIHISGFYWAQLAIDPSRGHLYVFATVNEAVRFALFGFMFISGLLLTIRHGGRFQFSAFMRKRVLTILVPYLAWVLLYLVFAIAIDDRAAFQVYKILRGSHQHLKIALSWLLFGSWPHLYFINMLFQMYLIYAIVHRPVNWLIASPRRIWWLVAALVLIYPCWIYLRFIPYRHPHLHLPYLLHWMAKNPNRLAFEWLVPFGFGLCCGAYYAQCLHWCRRWWPLVLCATLAALLTTVRIVTAPWYTAHQPLDLQHYGWPFSYLQPLLRLVYALGFACLLLPALQAVGQHAGDAKPAWLQFWKSFAAASFGVYLVHPILLELLRRYRFSPRAYHHSAYLYLLGVTLIATGLSYLIVIGVSALGRRVPGFRWMPSVLFGGS